MSNNGYTSEKDMSKILRNVFGICDVKWAIKHPDYKYSGLATCTAEIDGLNISVVAFPLLVGYEQPGIPIYRAHIISNGMLAGDSIIDESQIAQYLKKGIQLKHADGKITLKKTIDPKTHNIDSVNTIDPEDLKESIYSIIEATAELEQNAIKTEH